jgi:hypothetical protein
VKDENGDLLADSHNILNKWKDYFCQLLNVHRVRDVRQIEIQRTAEQLLPDPSPFEGEVAISNLKRYTENYWVFGLCPSSRILETRKQHNVSETGSVSVFR